MKEGKIGLPAPAWLPARDQGAGTSGGRAESNGIMSFGGEKTKVVSYLSRNCQKNHSAWELLERTDITLRFSPEVVSA